MSYTVLETLQKSLPALLLIVSNAFQPVEAAWGQVIRDDQESFQAGGSRGAGDAYYRRLIAAHATFAVLTFMLVIPLAIISARYTKHVQKNGGWWKNHARLNTLSVAFITIVFVLGLTIFIALLLQFTFGCINSFILSKPHVRTPIQNRLHIVFGWLIFGLGIAQIPVGMVLYGSPIWAFTLFGIAGGLLLLTMMTLEVVIGRREDHNVNLKTYQLARNEEGEGPGDTPPEVNWNGELVNEKRKMLGFGRE